MCLVIQDNWMLNFLSVSLIKKYWKDGYVFHYKNDTLASFIYYINILKTHVMFKSTFLPCD